MDVCLSGTPRIVMRYDARIYLEVRVGVRVRVRVRVRVGLIFGFMI